MKVILCFPEAIFCCCLKILPVTHAPPAVIQVEPQKMGTCRAE